MSFFFGVSFTILLLALALLLLSRALRNYEVTIRTRANDTIKVAHTFPPSDQPASDIAETRIPRPAKSEEKRMPRRVRDTIPEVRE
jgi:hypothetical protein